MNKFLESLIEGQSLSETQSYEMMTLILKDNFSEPQLSAMLALLARKGIEAAELNGFFQAVFETRTNVQNNRIEKFLDICGTGGDGKNTFNISTTAAFIIAGAGYPVIKWGNASATSSCGSSDVLVNLGIKLPKTQDEISHSIEKTGIVFLHAPYFYPLLKKVGHTRKALGIKTVFNILGPLLHPVQDSGSHRLIGVSDLRTMRLYSTFIKKLSSNIDLIYSTDGYDEISLTAEFFVESKASLKTFTPEKLGLNRVKNEDIFGGIAAEDNANILISILEGNATRAQNEVVLTNAAFALRVLKPNTNFSDLYSEVKDSLFSKKALKCLKIIREL